MRFWKYEALGNDYAVLEPALATIPSTSAVVRRICDRHFGLGADGILLPAPDRDAATDFPVRIFNPDGSEAEKSGNGIRIFARFLWDQGRVGEASFDVRTAGGPVRCTVSDAGRRVEVEMGRISFDSTVIPVAGPPREVLRESLSVAGRTLTYSAATIGNPHCVILSEQVSAAEAAALGPLIEHHPAFPRRTNVQFVQVLARDLLRMEIWERGAGYTLASGSSCCAAVAVVHRLGLCDRAVRVEMPGGTLDVSVGADYAMRIAGPVGRVAEGVLATELLAAARAP